MRVIDIDVQIKKTRASRKDIHSYGRQIGINIHAFTIYAFAICS